MCSIKQKHSAHFVGNLTHLRHRMFIQVKAPAQRNKLGVFNFRLRAQAIDIDGIAVCQNRRINHTQTIKPRTACRVVRHMPANARRRCNDRVARFAARHEGIEIGNRPRWHANLGKLRLEDFTGQCSRDHLDLLNRLKPHLVFVTRVAQRGPRADPAREKRLGARVHHVGRRVEVKALCLVNALVVGCQRLDPCEHIA